ncbi:MAG: 4-hydroxy-tetrahydrodipicolinate reductase [Kiritimatiellia bacterium]|nr:4-hydroxy-tetrahydrodipicolinate reductase [Kiritimatiellia bacterium]
MIKIAIFGAGGKMGQALIRCARRLNDLKVVAAIEADQHPFLGKDAGIVAGTMDIGVLISDDVRKGAAKADVLIDFSFPSSSAKHALLAAEIKKPIVFGTTGLNKKESECLRKASARTAVLWSPNMSLGVNILDTIIGQIAKKLANYDIEIIETHHAHKTDAPSGTALRLAETAAAARGVSLEHVAVYGRQGNIGARPPGQIGVLSVRAGDVVGDHTVIFATEGERLEITHRASSRECFALGALRAAQWLVKRPPGFYDMRDVLGIRK